MLKEFQVYHQKSMPYHPQAIGTMESFNKIMNNVLTKVCNMGKDDWDVRIPMVLWVYRMMCKKLTRQTPFRLVYGIEMAMPMEYIVPSLCIMDLIELADRKTLEEWLVQFMDLKQD